jgi:FixJ family two-component response regulator
MSGLLLQRRLAEMNSAVPIVFVTARAPHFKNKRLAQGAVVILTKPFTNVDLLRAIRPAVSSSDTV